MRRRPNVRIKPRHPWRPRFCHPRNCDSSRRLLFLPHHPGIILETLQIIRQPYPAEPAKTVIITCLLLREPISPRPSSIPPGIKTGAFCADQIVASRSTSPRPLSCIQPILRCPGQQPPPPPRPPAASPRAPYQHLARSYPWAIHRRRQVYRPPSPPFPVAAKSYE